VTPGSPNNAPAPTSVHLPKCPSCDSVRTKRMRTPGHWIDYGFFHEGEYGLERCLDCGLVFTNPRPTENHLAEFYSRPGYQPHEAGAQDTSAVRHLLHRINYYQPGLRSGGRFLDYGCGGGTLLAAATEKFSRVSGFDLSPEAVKSCRATGIQATTISMEIPVPVDAMLLCQCLEHVSDYDGLFQTIRRILRPGSGRIFIAVPNARGLRAVLSPHVLTRFAGANSAIPPSLPIFRTSPASRSNTCSLSGDFGASRWKLTHSESTATSARRMRKLSRLRPAPTQVRGVISGESGEDSNTI